MRAKGDMQDIELGNTGLRAPQIGFGCSALLGRSGRTESLRALAAAWDEGIRFFDTARSYGYGESETLLGEFLQGRRGQAIISTKFGILATRQSTLEAYRKDCGAKDLGSGAFGPFHSPQGSGKPVQFNQFTVQVLHQSIEQSLRKLGTDCVDILFLHAAPANVLDQDVLLEALGRLVEAGKVRIAGLSAEPDVIELRNGTADPTAASDAVSLQRI